MSTATDWTRLPLTGHGRSLVEASAGTGKTWTITVLYLRLLLEYPLSPRRIIVSTFTNAAAAELAERLRGKLLWALNAAAQHRDGHVADDASQSDRQWLRSRWLVDAALLERDVQRLQAALTEFDSAPISTLHALCARILAEHPFAAGARFRSRALVDGKSLETALIDDLWRVITQAADSDELVQLAQAAAIERKHLSRYLPVLLQPNVEVAAVASPLIVQAIEAVVGDPKQFAAELDGVLGQAGLLRAGGKLQKAWRALADALADADDGLADALSEARSTLLEAADLKGVNAAGKQHPQIQRLIAQSTAIAQSVSELTLDRAGNVPLRRFLAAAQRWCRQALQSRLEAANQSTFDQLLVAVRDALPPRQGRRALADALYAEWPLALVDEFQDTDPVQFGILDAIYQDADGQPRGRLLMIGDPKQAIYRFRGGDVQAYQRAKAAVAAPDRLALVINHRSSRSYVEAINRFYAVTGTQLGPADADSRIHYQPVQPSGRRDQAPLRRADSGALVERPLLLHTLAADDPASDLEAYALRACAGQIVWALSQHGYRIGDRALAPGDIAVLLPSHAQIARLAALLRARGVPCVVSSPNSVFNSDSARDLRLVLYAALHAEDSGALRAALATRLYGLNLGQLQALRHDAAGWDAHAEHFHELGAALHRRGPMAVVATLLERQARRWMDCVDGERLLTDLRHLGELLQEAWVECGGGERLAAWFAAQMDGAGEGADAAEARALRLESDAARVKLMTLHASKGLEFGIVFLPLMWKHTRPTSASRSAQWLSSADGASKWVVIGPARTGVEQQEYQERFRMLYVVLTRAIHGCHLFVLPPGDAVSERIGKARAAKGVPLNSLDLAKLEAEATATACPIAFVPGWRADPEPGRYHEAVVAVEQHARPLPAAPPGPLPMRHSFTTLSGGGRRQLAEEDGAAEDEALVEPAIAEHDVSAETGTPLAGSEETFHSELDALSALAGTQFGNAVHGLFEHRVAGTGINASDVLAALHEHGVRPRVGDLDALVEPLARRLQTVLETALGDDDGPRLGELAAGDLRAELEFNYRLEGVALGALRQACERHGEPGLVPRREQRLAGLMNGKIDLVFAHRGRFHVLDYKGNQLARGARACLQDYAPAALQATMASTGYRFQALLYTVAVERLLRERLGGHYRRDHHLGDCWYLFIRAVGLRMPDGTPCGVWRHRFGDDLLNAVQALLGGAEQELR